MKCLFNVLCGAIGLPLGMLVIAIPFIVGHEFGLDPFIIWLLETVMIGGLCGLSVCIMDRKFNPIGLGSAITRKAIDDNLYKSEFNPSNNGDNHA